MPPIRLVCWNEDLAQERARALKKAGFSVDASPIKFDHFITRFRAASPSAVLIDLDRLPSHGHAVGVMLRRSKSMRHVPIVFAGGVAEKIERIRKELPDALFTEWTRVESSIKKALRNPPAQPVQPPDPMHRYTGSSLVKKLGFKPNMNAALLGAPDGFEEQLGELPEGVKLETKMTRNTNMVLWFVRSGMELERETSYLAARLPEGASIWIIFPKQSSRYRLDFSQKDVLRIGLCAGLAQYKMCAVDADWSGLKFAQKRRARR